VVGGDGDSVYVRNDDSVGQFSLGTHGRSPQEPRDGAGLCARQGNRAEPERQVHVRACYQAVSLHAVGIRAALMPRTVEAVDAPGAGGAYAVASPEGQSLYVTEESTDTVAQYDGQHRGAAQVQAPRDNPDGRRPDRAGDHPQRIVALHGAILGPLGHPVPHGGERGAQGTAPRSPRRRRVNAFGVAVVDRPTGAPGGGPPHRGARRAAGHRRRERHLRPRRRRRDQGARRGRHALRRRLPRAGRARAERRGGRGWRGPPIRGAGRLYGGPRRDLLHGGPGNDRLKARDGRRNRVVCGRGRDVVKADRLNGCERVGRDSP
jgi:hypothetical protein